MKIRTIVCQVFLIFVFVFSLAPEEPSAETKILVVLSGDEENARTAEDLLAKYLFEKEYEVITSAELGAEDIQNAKQGKAREVTANYGAHFLLTGSVRSKVSSRETSTGIKLERAVTTLSYKVLDASGRRVHRGSVQNDSAGRSPDEAVYGSFDYMASDVAEKIAEKIPSVLSSSRPQEAGTATGTGTVASAGPQIHITDPPVEEATRGLTRTIQRNRDTITIKGEVADNTGIRSVTINGAPVRIDTRGGFSHPIALNLGQNNFSVAAVNNRGMTATKDFTIIGTRGSSLTRSSDVIKLPRKGTTLWGLIIGVSQYQSPGMSLKYADADAKVLAQLLKTQQGKLFSEVRIKTLINKDVIRENIIKAFGSHLGMAAPGDVVFIFIAGHGIKHQQSGSYYFVTHDANIENLVSRGMRMSDFEENVKILSKNTNVGKLIMVIDSCHSGAMQMEGLRAVGSIQDDLADALQAAEGQFILSAAKGGQASIEARRFRLNQGDSGHGAFTFALIKGMRGEANYDGDEYISLTELFQYVSKQVPRLTGGRQHPYSRIAGTDMPFILLK